LTDTTSPTDPAYDEVYGAFGMPRPHQQLLLEHLGMAGSGRLDVADGQLKERLAGVRRRIRERLSEQEVSYNILGAPDGSQRPWDLDVFPWVLDPAEFELLAEGLRQRARLIDAVLHDLYGEQRLLARGLVPPQVCLGNPHFFRACHGWQPLGGGRLYLYAADVARTPNGQFVVFSDRTAAPTGSGYALENRLVMGRVHEQAFRAYPVRKVNTFFQTLRTTLDELAPPRPHASGTPPRMVVLSAGAQDESSFEHAYLARYFGVELVEGRDLTVRDDAVYMKTLGGLRRVDVILRRVMDDYCDPLELREGALGGVPGLVGAARAGQVAIANPLGSGLLESAALQALLPELARELLGEELRLASVPTWWCGRAPDLAYVLEHLDELVIKPAFDERRAPPIEPAALTRAEKAEWVTRLRAKPGEFVAQRWPQRSVGPYWAAGGVAQGHLALRLFLCRSADDFTAMPGGLARVASSPDGLFLFVAGEQGSKDVWVPAVGPVGASVLPSMPERDGHASPRSDDLPSRLLDDLYWLGRSLERADNIARVVRHGVDRAGDEVSWAGFDVELCAELLRLLEVLPPGGARTNAGSLSDRVLELLGALHAPGLQNDLHAALLAVRSLTQRVRSRLSRDVWYALRQVSALAEELTEGKHREEPARWVDRLLLRTAAVSGGLLENMVRGSAWSFVEMGRRVERGAFVLALLGTFLPGAAERSQLEAVLEITDSLLSYRARYLSQLEAEHVVHLLLTDETNPHSVAFQLQRIHEELERVRAITGASESPELATIQELTNELRARHGDALCANGAVLLGQEARSWLQRVWDFSDALTERYFSHAAGELRSAGSVWVDENLEAKGP
jgi:uncharacterized circularly permuted ATP-grasp superfamily protein/uncharacterized alpha-E superfamily protein